MTILQYHLSGSLHSLLKARWSGLDYLMTYRSSYVNHHVQLLIRIISKVLHCGHV